MPLVDRSADHEPGHVSAGEEIIGGCPLFLPDHPPDDCQHDAEITRDRYPVQRLKSTHDAALSSNS